MRLLFRAGSPLFELVRVLVRFNHVASIIVNADNRVMGAAEKLCVIDCVADSTASATAPQLRTTAMAAKAKSPKAMCALNGSVPTIHTNKAIHTVTVSAQVSFSMARVLGLTRTSSATADGSELSQRRQLFHKIKSGHRSGQRLDAMKGCKAGAKRAHALLL